MNTNTISKLIFTIMVCFAVLGCSTPANKFNSDLVAAATSGHVSCGQVQTEISHILNEPQERSSLDTLSRLALMFSGPVALPLIIGKDATSSSYSKSKANRKEQMLDGLEALFNDKKCVLSIQLDRRENVFRNAVLSMSSEETTRMSILTPDLETLSLPGTCTNAKDDIERIYELVVNQLGPDEYLRFSTRGVESSNHKIKASLLRFGPVKLPKMSISSRKGGYTRGLWVERLKTGEKHQLNYLPPNRACNSKSRLTVRYDNIWVTSRQLSQPNNSGSMH